MVKMQSGIALSRRRQRAARQDQAAVGGSRKRAFDLSAACIGLIVWLPILLLIALAIKVTDTGPIFYRHRRIGRNGRAFDCLKFRTMVTNADERLGRLLATNDKAAKEWQSYGRLKKDPRITPIGALLRSTSLDELPQLFNILKGEMSFVGPRPVVAAEITKYGKAIKQYFRARPGMTGLWQISGRSADDYITRVALDSRYVKEWSFMRDLEIVGLTTFTVLNLYSALIFICFCIFAAFVGSVFLLEIVKPFDSHYNWIMQTIRAVITFVEAVFFIIFIGSVSRFLFLARRR
jgi:exopolysaccharide production protein ExoY